MDQERVSGSNKEVKGAAKVAMDLAIGNAKLQNDAQADKASGKIQNYGSGLNAAVRDAEAMKSAGLLVASSIGWSGGP
jgi:uncharacterized protein YjbJ (UPF0337 family)